MRKHSQVLLLDSRRSRTYYVDSVSGSDSNSGLTPEAPWQTIAKLNTTAFEAGDTICFRRGRTWTGTTLQPVSRGTSRRPIVWDAYGEGSSPVIERVTDHVACRIENSAFHTFRNLTFRGIPTGNYAFLVITSSGIAVEDCVATNANWAGFGVRGGGSTTYDIRFTRCTAYGNAKCGFLVDNSPSYVDGARSVVIETCTAYNNGTNSAADHGIYCNSGDGIIVRGCTSYNNKGAGAKLNSTTNSVIGNCHLWSNGNPNRQNYGVFLDRESGAVCRGNSVYNNLVVGCMYGIYLNGSVVEQNIICYNTVVISEAKGVVINTGTANQVLVNNIFRQDADIHGQWDCVYYIYQSGSLPLTVNTIDYNCVTYDNDPTRVAENNSGTRWSFAQWQALTGSPDVHSISTDPRFITEYTNMRLRSDSPCINAGNASFAVPFDMEGKPRLTPDQGCYAA